MSSADAARLYLDLLKGVLTRIALTDLEPEKRALAEEGRVALPGAETMIGLRRLDNLEACVRAVVEDGVPGDLMECGVWRGGASIFMRAMLEALGDRDRHVWVADSFRGIPAPNPDVFPEDAAVHVLAGQAAASLDEVRENFSRYGLLDDRVTFVEGLFSDTLPNVAVGQLAILRLDGDLYESTFVALEALYDRVAPGGFVIIDDYHSLDAARIATEDFRRDRDVDEPLEHVDWTGAFWRKRR